MPSCKTVSEHFVCDVQTVWQVLTDASAYKDWFGWPETLDLLEVDPGFRLGGKLTFRNSASTLVISEFVPEQKLVLTGGYRTDEITLRASQGGCRVSIVTTTNGVQLNNTEAAQETVNRNILKNLRRRCYAALQQSGDVQDTITSGTLSEQLFRIARGYRPVHQASEGYVPGTEQNLFIPTRSGILGTVLCFVLAAVLSLTLTFERSDVVPSSGLSVAESELVTFENAENIYIGQKKSDLEVMLSCTGRQLNLDEYTYSSTEKTESGEPARVIHVVYDAYGEVRRYGYVDNALCTQSGVPLRSIAALLSSSMTAQEAAESLGIAPGAYWVDKSGKSYLYFGRYVMGRTLFDPNKTAELVVSLDSTAMVTRFGYYLAEDTENPLHIAELGRLAKRQYSSLSQYRNDLAFYQRLFLLQGRSREEVEAVLGMTELLDETTNRDGSCKVSYVSGQTGENSWRYRFSVTYSADGIMTAASLENTHLAAKQDALAETYALEKGITLYDAYAQLQILPSYAELEADGTLRLAYGARLRSSGTFARSWQLALWLDANGILQRTAAQ
ncbi:MAG: SRPBCC domain-containing protein [Oscillospiraceae bacterium]|nr:SRPBCC domain-containing protein [Oscillospiraceae bacterium]